MKSEKLLARGVCLLSVVGLLLILPPCRYIYKCVMDEWLLDSIVYKSEPDAHSAACVEGVLRLGANPNITNEYGVTPLMIAIAAGQPRIVETLLQHGADPNWPTETGNAMLWARVKAASDPAVKPTVPRMIAMLKAAGAKEWVHRPSSKREANSDR